MEQLTYRFRIFAHRHDDIPAFHAAYLVGTFLAASVLHLGFFAILIAAHMCLDYVKYRDYFHYDLRLTFKAMALESVVDIALFLIAMTFAVYFSNSFLLAAASGMTRSGLTVLKAFGTVVPKIRILEEAVLIALNLHAYLYTPHTDIRKPLSRTHQLALATIGVASVLIVAASLHFIGNEMEFLSILSRELSLRF